MKPTIAYISLGCPRNLVDTEVMLGNYKKAGYRIKDTIEGADIAIINTCGFIEDAKKESIDVILKVIELKKEKKVGKIIVAGCLCQRYAAQLKDEFKEVDEFIGVPGSLYSHRSPRYSVLPPHYKYIKISEGCSNRCSYCAIPDIKGPHRSRPKEDILKEAQDFLEDKKTRELNIIGQDTTLYGNDIYGEQKLAELLKRICALKDKFWARFLYTHPAHFTDDLIDLLARENNLCKYIDLPIQHINDRILEKMKRGVSKKDILELLDKIRSKVPQACIRTSVIVGFPGETDKEFEELLEFIKSAKFQRLGAFIYSREEETPAYKFPDQVSQKIKQERFDELMKLQRQISEENNSRLMGREIEVLVEEKDPDSKDLYIGRSQYDAPEVDGCVYVKGRNLKLGEFVNTKVVDTLEYDFVAEKV